MTYYLILRVRLNLRVLIEAHRNRFLVEITQNEDCPLLVYLSGLFHYNLKHEFLVLVIVILYFRSSVCWNYR